MQLNESQRKNMPIRREVLMQYKNARCNTMHMKCKPNTKQHLTMQSNARQMDDAKWNGMPWPEGEKMRMKSDDTKWETEMV